MYSQLPIADDMEHSILRLGYWLVRGAPPASWWLGWWRQKALSEHVAKKRMRGERTKYACDTQTRSSVRTRSYVLVVACATCTCTCNVCTLVVFILRYSTTCTTACARVAMSRSHSRSLAWPFILTFVSRVRSSRGEIATPATRKEAINMLRVQRAVSTMHSATALRQWPSTAVRIGGTSRTCRYMSEGGDRLHSTE